MEGFTYVVIFITTATPEEACRISRALIEQKEAACVSMVPRVNSNFWWRGKLDSREENLLIVKTKASLLDRIVKLVKEIHSDDVPEIIVLPIIGGSKDYLDWLDKAV